MMTKKTGLIGWPVEHSLSPAIQNGAFEKFSLPWSYGLYPLEPENFDNGIKKLRDELDGFNVTFPHKESVLAHLDDILPAAAAVGAVNCAKKENGRWTGTNTDSSGFLKALKEDINPSGKNIFILGAGGAAKAAAFSLADAGARKIFIKDPDSDKAHDLINRLNRFAPAQAFSISADFAGLADCEVLVNATPLGMSDERIPLPAGHLHKGLYVFECIYNRETPLLKAAAERGLSRQDGLNMLVYQAADSFTFWTGKDAPLELMKEIVKKGGRK